MLCEAGAVTRALSQEDSARPTPRRWQSTLMGRNAWIAMVLVVLIIVLLLVGIIRSVGELQEIFEEDDEANGGPKPEWAKRDERLRWKEARGNGANRTCLVGARK
jgi:hypothetical protein